MSTARFTSEAESVRDWVHRDLALLHKIAVKANEAESFRSAVAFVIESVCRHQGWTIGHAFLLRRHPAPRFHPVDSCWTCLRSTGFERLRELTRANSFEPGDGLVGVVGQRDEPAWISNFATAAIPPPRFSEADLGVRSGLFIPVTLCGEKVAGAVLEFFSENKRRTSPAKLRLAGAVGGLLGRVYERDQAERRLAESREREQRRLGRELHDTISQDLTGVTFMAERICESLEDARSPQTERTRELVGHLSSIRSKVHALSRGLLPVEIDATGLSQALGNLVASTRQMYGIDCELRCEERDTDLGDSVAANQLARIAQEAVQNAAKHAAARRIDVSLTCRDSLVTLTVSDDGVGFSKASSGGVGLLLMRHRAMSIGARLTIDSGPGEGTRVRCQWSR